MLKFLLTLLGLLIGITPQINIYYDNSSVSILLSNTYPLTVTNSATDQCLKLLLRTNALYHLSAESVLENWMPGTAVTNVLSFPQSGTSYVKDFSVDTGEALTTTLDYIAKKNDNYLLLPGQMSFFFYGTAAITSAQAPTQIYAAASGIFYFYPLFNGTHDAIVKAMGTNTTYQLSTVNGDMYLSPDESLIAICQQDSRVFLYRASDLSLLQLFSPAVAVTPGATESITFDSTSTLMII